MFLSKKGLINYHIVLIRSQMLHLTACKLSVSPSFLNLIKNEMIFYRVSKLKLATLIQRFDKTSFHFKNERLTKFLQDVRVRIL